MRRRWIATMSLAVVLCVTVACKDEAATDQATENAAAQAGGELTLEAPKLLAELTVTSGDKAPVTLRYKPAQEPVTYAVTLVQQSIQEREGKRIQLGTEQTFDLVRKVKERGEDHWVAELHLQNLTVKPDGESKHKEMNMATEAIAKALQGTRFVVTTDALGTVREISLQGGDINRWQGMKEVLEQLVKESAVALPEQQVAPEDQWPTPRETLLKKRKTANRISYDLSTTFLGYAALPDLCQRCAVLRIAGPLTIEGTVTAPGMEGSTTGRGKSDTVVAVDVDRGLLVASETATVSRQEFALSGKGGKVTFAEESRTRYAQRLKAPAKPAAGKDGAADSPQESLKDE